MKHFITQTLTICTFFLLFSIQVNAQVITMTNGGNDQACSGTFFDPGGTGNYSYNSTTFVHTICSSTPGEFPKVEFTSFALWTNGCISRSYDKLKVYDGPTTSSPLIANYEQTQGLGKTLIGSSGCLTFQFIRETGSFLCASNSGAPGWEGIISCIDVIPPTGTSCSDAIPFCSDENYNFPNGTSGTAPSGPNYGACSAVTSGNGLDKPVWYYMQIEDPGTLQLHLHQTTGPNETGSDLDLDFVMWGPYTSISDACTQIMAGDPPIQRSYDPAGQEDIGIGVPGGTNTHCGNDGYGPTTPPPALAGEIYVVMITNPSGSSGFISFEQTGGTGSADCAIVTPCSIDNFTGNPSTCNNNLFDITGSIEFDDAPGSGDLIVEDCNGNQTIVASAPFSSPVSYSLIGLAADGNPCSLSAYFSEDVACSNTINYTAPTCSSCIPPSLTINNIQVCAPNTADLASSIDASSDPATTTFYNSQIDANNAVNAIGNSVTSSGSYWVRAEDPNDPTCFATYEIQVTISPIPNITITSTDPTCGNTDGEINIVLNNTVTAPVIYVIGNGVPDQTNNGLFPGLAAGSYTITVTDNNNCSATGTETLTNSGTAEDASFTLTDFCEGLTNIATITGTNGGTFSIVSPTGDGATINTGTGEITDGVGGTSYTVKYETSGACTDSETRTVTVNPNPTYSLSSTNPSCGNSDGEIIITQDPGFSITDYSIDNGTTTQAGGTFSNLGAGTYNIKIIDDNGCEATGTHSLNNQNGPTIDSITTIEPSCSNNDGELEVAASGGNGTLNYEWFNANNQSIGTGTTINGLSGGNYSVKVTDGNGCATTNNITLTDPPVADDAKFVLTDFCAGSTNSANSIASLGGTFSIVSPLNDEAVIDTVTGEISNGVPGTTYTIEYETSGACPSISTEQVTVLFSPNVSFSATPNDGVPPLTVEFENTTSSSDNFIWNFGEGDTIHDNNIILSYIYENTGDYTVVLTGETTEGCVDTATIHILVGYPPMEYAFPNIFTPNGDGQNDMFKLINPNGIKEIDIVILNRWGNVVFEDNIVNFMWNGRVKNSGSDCEDGTYFYKANLKGFDGTEKMEQGFVQLSRDK